MTNVVENKEKTVKDGQRTKEEGLEEACMSKGRLKKLTNEVLQSSYEIPQVNRSYGSYGRRTRKKS